MGYIFTCYNISYNQEGVKMIKVFINGICGRMGNEVAKLVLKEKDMNLLGGLDRHSNSNLSYPIFSNINSLVDFPNVIIDFSTPEATLSILPYCLSHHIPIVIATTGFSKEQQKEITDASLHIPIFQSNNMSYEITLISHIISELSQKLPNADIEIVETHHNQKKDSPSGTALLLADSINVNSSYIYELNRTQKREKRNPKEIGFSSIRGGNIVGEHSVLFFSPNETIEIKHTAHSRAVFAEGAIKAANFLVNQKAGLYSMKDLIPY